jgi:hypothetical protein
VNESKKKLRNFPTCVELGGIRMWIGIVLIDADPDLDRNQDGKSIRVRIGFKRMPIHSTAQK